MSAVWKDGEHDELFEAATRELEKAIGRLAALVTTIDGERCFARTRSSDIVVEQQPDCYVVECESGCNTTERFIIRKGDDPRKRAEASLKAAVIIARALLSDMVV